MASTKRKGAFEESDEVEGWCTKMPRRARRVQLVPRKVFDEEWDQVGELNKYLHGIYNTYVPFAQKAPARSRTRKAGLSVQRRLNRMQEILDKAREELLEEEEYLYGEVDEFVAVNSKREHWFLDGNLFTLSFRQLGETLRSQTPVSPEALTSWAQRSFTDEVLRSKEERQYVAIHERELDQVDKLFILFRTLYGLPQGQRHAFHVAVSFLTDMLPHTATKPSTYKYFRRVFQAALDRHNRNQHMSAPGAPTHLDLAGLARNLGEQFNRSIVGDEDSCPGIGEIDLEPRCFHTATAPILALLRQQAHSELRGKVMLTAGTLLPAELGETLFEYALVAEGLPLDRRAYVDVDILTEFGAGASCDVVDELKEWRQRQLAGIDDDGPDGPW